MTRIEDRIRQSLRRRAHDVESTPALWQRVSHRIDRRTRRRQLLSALAGVTALVLLVVVAVPTVLERFQPDRAPQILDAPATESPAPADLPARVPAAYAATDGASVELRDTSTGAVERELLGPVGDDLDIETVAVRPGSTADELTLAAAVRDDDQYTIFAGHVDGSGPGDWTSVAQASFGPQGTEGIVAPQPVWSPDGRRLAWIETGDNGTGLYANLQIAPWGDDGQTGDAQGLPVGGMPMGEAAGQVALADWTGATADAGDQSTLTHVTGEGELWATSLERDAGGTLQEVDASPVATEAQVVVDEANGHLSRGPGEGPTYLLNRTGEPGTDESSILNISVVTPDEPVVSGAPPASGTTMELPTPEAVAGAAPEDVWMTARGNGVLVGLRSQTRAWLVTRPAEGGDDEVRPLAGTTVSASFLDVPQAAPESPPTSDEASPTMAPPETPVGDASSSVVVADGRRLVLLDRASGGTQTLLDMPAEGESTIRNVAVRPGATSADMTVAFMALSEGMYDLRYVVVRDGEPGDLQYLPPEMQPPEGAGNPGEISIPAPVWSPDGDALAFVETIPEGGGTQQLRVIGWGDDAPSEDPSVRSASFGLASLPEPVQLQDWVWTEDADTGALLATEVELSQSAEVRIPIQRQGDGAFAQGPDDALVLGTQVPVLDVADAHARAVEPETPSARLRWFQDGSLVMDLDPTSESHPTVSLPDELADAVAAGERPWVTAREDRIYLGVADQAYVIQGQDLQRLDLPDGLVPGYVAPLPSPAGGGGG